MNKNRNFEKLLLEYLRTEKKYSELQIEQLQSEANKNNILLQEHVVIQNIASESELIKLAENYLLYPVVNLDRIQLSRNLSDLIPQDLLYKYMVAPFRDTPTEISIAMATPSNLEILDDLKQITKLKVIPYFALASQIRLGLDHFYAKTEMENMLKELENSNIIVENNDTNKEAQETNPISTLTGENDGSDEPTIIKMVNSVLNDAVACEASDIHIEPLENSLRIRMRIDGLLVEKATNLDKGFLSPFTSRIKILSNLDISEKRKPQDGRFKVKIGGRTVDIRVSTMPTQFGEKIVMRLTSKSFSVNDLRNLGFSQSEADLIKKFSERPYGLILTTGPTGSGKSTTLYGMLSYVNTVEKNIVTIEDPIERQIPGVTQTSVNNKIGVNFAEGLKTILRQDPDIVMIGEIRDKETAEMTIQSALTGHLVLSTLHTNDSVGGITRLKDMGVEAYKIPSAVLGIIAQRLIRKVCPACKEAYTATVEDRAMIKGLLPNIDLPENLTLYRAKGCKHCSGTGYKGRMGVFEILELDEGLKQLILEDVSTPKMKQYAVEHGLETMDIKAVKKVLEGETTMEEVNRVMFIV